MPSNSNSLRRSSENAAPRWSMMKNRPHTRCLALALVLLQANPSGATEQAEILCPGASAWRATQASINTAKSRTARAVSKPALRKKLLMLAQRDQEVRSETSEDLLGREAADKDAFDAIKRIVARSGFPKESEVGRDGVNAAWLLVQHASMDPGWQFEVLQQLESSAASGEISGEQFALLYDRVAVLYHHKMQKYGTQLQPGAETAQPLPIEEADSVDARRAELGMMPLRDYLCLATALRSERRR